MYKLNFNEYLLVFLSLVTSMLLSQALRDPVSNADKILKSNQASSLNDKQESAVSNKRNNKRESIEKISKSIKW